MAKKGLVVAEAQTRGVGRPIQLWQLTESGNTHFPDAHGELAVQLLRLIRTQLGDNALELLIDSREQETRDQYCQAMVGVSNVAERVERLVAIRTGEGYMAQSQVEADGTILLIENHCPIWAAAASCQRFCRTELAVFQQALGVPVERVEHILSGARRCTYRIHPE
ncbi:helix-turn-helix transcriptional regulator [Yersinia pseudotuberculosis]|uniref:helix-turn-helix transcriptional regulator n=1 Tax=Yersinia pseudotuberculosis TaxID=633 RepID=UPI00215DAD9E|nr:metalloregulator ArsR/SmtB family transcription factor [Yersinia pseudotuberculosis]